MPGPEFFQTRMGAVFFESTMPEIARQLKRIADALEALVPKDHTIDKPWDGKVSRG